MSLPPFLRSEALLELGIEHGLGTRRSEQEPVPDLVRVTQVHGNRMVRVPPFAAETRADALWTQEPGVAVGVQTADCVPILLVDASRRAVAAVHAGWRGSAAKISKLVAKRLADAIRTDPAQLIAVIGPHIGPCCYEVDEPVRAAIGVDEVFSASQRQGHYLLDLLSLNRLQLLKAGLREDRILRVGGCTFCSDTTYASHRRDGSGERMVHFVRMPLP
jgi:YfiH family protein